MKSSLGETAFGGLHWLFLMVLPISQVDPSLHNELEIIDATKCLDTTKATNDGFDVLQEHLEFSEWAVL